MAERVASSVVLSAVMYSTILLSDTLHHLPAQLGW
jgi:hypothetical protein